MLRGFLRIDSKNESFNINENKSVPIESIIFKSVL